MIKCMFFIFVVNKKDLNIPPFLPQILHMSRRDGLAQLHLAGWGRVAGKQRGLGPESGTPEAPSESLSPWTD